MKGQKNEMTPSQQAKAAGLKNLVQAAEISNKPRRTLENYHKTNPQFFKVVIAGCVSVKQLSTANDKTKQN